jgi:hypothetical protein
MCANGQRYALFGVGAYLSVPTGTGHHGAHVADRFVLPCSVLKVKDFGFKVNKESELQDA